MKIGFDARMLGGTFGLGRYAERLITHLERVDRENEYVIFLRRNNWNRYSPSSTRFRKVLADIPWYSVSEQSEFPFILLKEQCDLVHFPHWNIPLLYRRPFVVTIHDLTMFRLPENAVSAVTTRNPIIHAIKHAAFRFVLASSLARARRIIVVSNAVKTDVCETFGLSNDRTSVIYEAADPYLDSPVQPATALPRQFFLYVGSCYPHKNLSRLLETWELFIKCGGETTLVLCGQDDVFTGRFRLDIEKRGLGSHIRHIGPMSDAELAFLYRKATALITASRREGFGLQLLEAMQYGTPVICSNIPTFREVAGDAAQYFNPDDPNDILKNIQAILNDDATRGQLSKKGRQRARLFSWDTTARQTQDIYVSCFKFHAS